MQKHTLTILFLLPLFASLQAQELAPTLITPAGGYTENKSGSLSWSAGEIAIEAVEKNQAVLTQGFQQIETDSNSVALPLDPKQIAMLIPNTFTPNDDGPNDSFDPVAILQDNKINITPAQAGITIVNRWGETVYHPSGYKAWTGKSDNGTTLPVSTYYYILSLKTNREINVKGPINLLR